MTSHKDAFEAYLLSVKLLSVNTVKAYLSDLSIFLDILTKPLLEVTMGDVEKFLSSRSLSKSSINRNIVALSTFFKFLVNNGVIENNPIKYLPSIKVKGDFVDILDVTEIDILINSIEGSSVEDMRDRAIITLLYSTGVRVSEMCALNVIDLCDNSVRVMGKGGKERVVPLSSRVVLFLEEYLNHRKGSEELFLHKGLRINRQLVWRMIKKRVSVCGLIKRVSPHSFRHAYATHVVSRGGDIRILQEILGHSSINTTNRYAHLSNKILEENFFRCHPRQ